MLRNTVKVRRPGDEDRLPIPSDDTALHFIGDSRVATTTLPMSHKRTILRLRIGAAGRTGRQSGQDRAGGEERGEDDGARQKAGTKTKIGTKILGTSSETQGLMP